ncbi:MAG: hypothetical protein HUJ69_02670 [Lachnospiraceae bacterium]|nr:hypothetical protein [Lachnospiraceae bacterium]
MAKSEVFVEQMIKKGSERSDMIRRIYLLVGGALILLLVVMLGYNAVILAGPVVLVMVALMVWILWRRVAQEYEYVYTEGNIDIDVVYSRTSRKHLFTLDLRKAVLIAPWGSPEAEKVLPGYKFDKTIYAIHDKPGENTYLVICEYLSRQTLVYFEPDSRILNHLKNYSPRNSVIRQEDLEKEVPNYWEELNKKKTNGSEEEVL